MIDWVQLLQTFGLAVVILFALGVAIWRAAGWFAREIVIPFRDKLLARMLEVLSSLESTVTNVDRKTDHILDLLSNGVNQVVEKTEEIKRSAAEVRSVIKPTS